MISTVNSALGRLGLELRRRPKSAVDPATLQRTQTAGWIVEFIGTQGIGKSTLNNHVHKTLRQNWLFRDDITKIGPGPVPAPDIERLHRDLYFKRIQTLQDNLPDAWSSITVARQMARVISESLTLMTNEYPQGFFLDESLFKNFPQEVLELAADRPTPLWNNRAVIYLRARDPSCVVERYQGRAAERSKQGLLLRPPSDAEITARVERDNKLFDQIIEKAQIFDCPSLVIYAEDSHESNVQKILDFENNMRHERPSRVAS